LAQFVDRVERGLIHRRTAEKLAEEEHRKEIRERIPSAAFTMSLEDLALSDRVYDLLGTSGYETIGDLMFQLALDEDAVLGISGIGPKAMDEIKDKIANVSFPTAEPEIVSTEAVEQPEPEAEPEQVVEVVEPHIEKIIEPEQPEVVEAVTEAEPSIVEQEVPVLDQVQLEPELVSEVETPVVSGEEEEPEKPVDFDEIFALRPEILNIEDTEEEEEEEELDQKGKKKKKKKKKFVEVVYDPDRDITLVKRKRKRGGDWDDDWNY
jgi:hypothetical protein